MKSKRSIPAQVQPIVIPPIEVDRFMYSDHYHCKTCGRQMKFLTRLRWIVGSGVRALGICQQCALILIEYENGKTLGWINFPT